MIVRLARPQLPAAIGVVLALVACSPETTTPESNAQIDTLSSGRIVVENTGTPAWTPETAWHLEEDLRLTEPEDQTGERFAAIQAMASDSRGRLFVLAHPHQIAVFGDDGEYSHAIGREGKGPGELAGATNLAIGPGDTLWVTDLGAGRYSVFAPDGSFVRVQQTPTRGYDISGAALADGSYVDWDVSLPEGPSRVVLQPVRFSPGFERTDSLPPLEFTQELMSNGAPRMLYTGWLTGAVDRDGDIWFAHTTHYRVFRRTLAGDTTLEFSLPARAGPVGERERETVRELLQGGPPDRIALYLESLPDTRPVVDQIIPDNAGHVYALVDVDGVPPASAVDVFGDNGEYLGRMTLPTPVPLFPPTLIVAHATPEFLYVANKDDLDVPYVSRLRIVRGGE